MASVGAGGSRLGSEKLVALLGRGGRRRFFLLLVLSFPGIGGGGGRGRE